MDDAEKLGFLIEPVAAEHGATDGRADRLTDPR